MGSFGIGPDQWRAAARAFEHEGRRIAYWTHGFDDAGAEEIRPTLLLIHGFPSSSWDWNFIWTPLSRRFRLVALDMLGFGLSAKPRRHNYRMTEQADIHEALLAELGVGETHILAHDYGVSVTQELIARRQDHSLSFSPLSVCFLNGGLFPEHHRATPVQKLAASPIGFLVAGLWSEARLGAAFNEVFGADTQPAPEEIAAHWGFINEQNGARILHRVLRYLTERRSHAARWRRAITEAPMPIALINGGADPVSGAHMHAAFCEAAPGAFTRLLPTIGHYPQMEAAGAVTDGFFKFQETLSPVMLSKGPAL